MTYLGTTDLKLYLSISGTVDDALLQGCINRAGSAIDAYCRRSFEATHGTRYYGQFYERRAGTVLFLDNDCLGISTLVNGDGATIPSGATAGYWLEPRNRQPYYAIRLKSSYVWTFNTDSEIVVGGTWGYSATVIPDVQQAALRYSAYVYHLRSHQGYDTVISADLGVVTVPEGMPKDVVQLLSPYRRSEYS